MTLAQTAAHRVRRKMSKLTDLNGEVKLYLFLWSCEASGVITCEHKWIIFFIIYLSWPIKYPAPCYLTFKMYLNVSDTKTLNKCRFPGALEGNSAGEAFFFFVLWLKTAGKINF